MPAVVAEGLTKTFGETEALRGVDFEIEQATVLGVLGPNGAGKTTAVRILTTLIKPDAGHATVEGIDVVADPQSVRARIGLTGQYAAVDERLTGWENLQHVGRLFHLGTRVARERADAFAALLHVGLRDRASVLQDRGRGGSGRAARLCGNNNAWLQRLRPRGERQDQECES